MEMGHWVMAEGVEFDAEAFGFIYRIDTPDGKWYVGQKHMTKRIRRPPLKGKKRVRICHVESDWKKYCSSSKIIQEGIDKHGEEGYTFQILKMCSCKFDLSYSETKMQFELEVLFDDNCLNGIINCRLGKVPKGYEYNG